MLCACLNCLRENGFVGADESVSLKKSHTLPSVHEKLGEEEGYHREKNETMAICRKYIGQMMCVPDISACLGTFCILDGKEANTS